MSVRTLVIVLGMAVGAVPAAGQPAVDLSGDDVRGVVYALFHAMRTADTAGVRSSFMKDGRLVSTWIRDEKPFTRVLSVDQFVHMVATSSDRYDERIGIVETRVDGDVASVWGRYSFRVGNRLTNCGRNAIQLFRTADGWRVSEFASTIIRDGCDEEESGPVVIRSGEWELHGNVVIPASGRRHPAVLMFNGARTDRRPYERLSELLAVRGIASLRVDLRGHGESTNRGEFVPGDSATHQMIWESESDIEAARRYLKSLSAIDSSRIAFVGASYSGEEMMDAARRWGHAAAYAALSPGSLSDQTIGEIDSLAIPWLLVVSKHERHLHEIAEAVRVKSRTAEILYLEGTLHGTHILGARPDLSELLAVWLERRLKK